MISAKLAVIKRGLKLPRGQRVSVARAVKLSLLSVAALLILVFFVSAYFFKERTFVLEAETRSLSVEFSAGANEWSFPSATVCRLLDRPDPLADAGSGPCDARFYSRSPVAGLVVSWPAGARMRATYSNTAGLMLLVKNPVRDEFQAGTLIHVAEDSFRAAGALQFTGYLELGSAIRPGEANFLVSGIWEARETGLVNNMFRSHVMETVKTGKLFRGSTASVWEANAPAVSFGHISASNNLDESLLHFASASAPGDVELRVEVFGAKQPSVIRPDIIDVAISSPFILAFAFLLSLLSSMVQIYSDVFANGE